MLRLIEDMPYIDASGHVAGPMTLREIQGSTKEQVDKLLRIAESSACVRISLLGRELGLVLQTFFFPEL